MKILFVCLGNICRSPLAAAIFNHKVKELKLQQIVCSDSCGTGNYHIGGAADDRSIAVARKNGVEIQHVVRQLTADDLEEFDHIIAMDRSNLANIKQLPSAQENYNKVKMMREYDPQGFGDVPDPYYGTEKDFKEVYEILDRSIEVFIDELISKSTN
ncbi:MAG: low molecular weight phosphotyrosine protein phosphatase [Cyclobacteriaceae bacterium]|nr:low molecular weight phosphotyrosine protein phosphatase [Cyclobacteriaceae bacterium]